MNELFGISYMLGRQRVQELLREAEAARRVPVRPAGGTRLRQHVGRTLVRLGLLLAGPHTTQPANGH